MTTPPTAKPRILVVEDEVIVARDISQQLAELGYEPVGHAAKGEDAIMMAGELLPDLVLMDIQLAGDINGIVAADAIRNHFALPVVFLTAFAADDMLEQAKLVEPFGYLLKPFSTRELRAVIEMALYKYQTEASLREEAGYNQAILDNMVDGVITMDSQARIHTFNPAASQIFGYNIDDVLGKNIDLLIPEAAGSSLSTDLFVYQQMAALRVKGFPTILQGRRKTGDLFPLRLSLSQVTRSGNTTYIGLFSDASIAKETPAELNHLAASNSQLGHHPPGPPDLFLPLQQLLHCAGDLATTPLTLDQANHVAEIHRLGTVLLHILEAQVITAP